MADPIVIRLKADQTDVKAVIDDVRTGLRKTKDEAVQTGAAVSKAFAGPALRDAVGQLQRAGGSFADLGAKVSMAAQRADTFNAQLRATATHERLLAQTQTPLAKSFGALADAMDRERAMLEAIRGPEQKRLADLAMLDSMLQRSIISQSEYNAKLAESGAIHGPVQQQGQGGGLGAGLVAGASIVGSVMIFEQIGNALQGMIRGYQDAADHLTNLENESRKFARAGQDINVVLADQTLLADKLHAPIEQSMSAYDRVRESADEYGLSQHELLRITQTLGEATLLANRSLDSAGDVVAKLHTVFESGANPARALRTVFTEYPGVLKSMEEAFHTNEAGLFRLASAHKLTFESMLRALGTHNAGVNALWQERQRTYSSEREEIYDLSQRFMAAGDNQVDAMKKAIDKFKEMKSASDDLNASLHPLSDTIASFGDRIKHDIVEPASALAVLKTWQAVTTSIAVANGYTVTYMNTGLGAIREAKKEMEALNIVHKAGFIIGQDYRQEWERLETILEHGKLNAEYRLLKEIQDPLVEYHDMIAALNNLYATGQIGLLAYNAQLERLVASAPKGSSFGMRGDGAGVRGNIVERHGGFTPQLDVAASEYEAPRVDPLAKEAQSLYMTATGAAGKYAEELDRIQFLQSEGYLTGEAGVRVLQDLHDRYDDAKLPATQFAEAVRSANEKLGAGIYNAQEYAKRIADIQSQFDKSAGQGARNFLRGINDQMSDAAVSQKMLQAGFDGLSQSISDLVTKGKTDLGSLFDQLAAEMTKLLLMKALLSIFGGGDIGSGATDVGALQGFAGGGVIQPGGSGGTDSQVVAFRKSPDERVRIETPAQQAAADGRKGGSSSGPSHGGLTVVNQIDRRAIIGALSTADGRQVIFNILRDMGFVPNR